MKKILFTSLLCASFAANVNLLPAPRSTNNTEEQASVLQAEQDDAFLKAQNDVVPLIKDLQRSGFCVYGPQNESLVKVFESKEKIKSVGEVLFPGSAFGKLVEMDAFLAHLAEKPEEAAKKALYLAKGFGWEDDAKENKSASSIANTLFDLYRALDAKEPNSSAITAKTYDLEEELKPVRTFWEGLEKLAKAEWGVLAQKIFADMFTEFRSGLTEEEAKLACDKLFAHMASSGGTIKEDSLSKALRSEDQEVKDLRQKLKTGPDGREIKIKDIFTKFLSEKLDVPAHKDLSKFFALMPHINKKTLNGQALVKIAYQGYALEEKQKAEAEAQAWAEAKDKLSQKKQELQTEMNALKVQQKALDKKSPKPKRR